MNKFDKITNDKTIINIYNKISEFEDLDKGLAHHDLNHVKNVAKLVEYLFTKLDYDENFIEEAKIVAILHDTGAIEGYNVKGMKELQYIKDILVDIHNNKYKSKMIHSCKKL